jgi:hypothetical protein
MSIFTKNQVRIFGPHPIEGYGKNALIKAIVQYDDQCSNGHNTFSITGEIYIPGKRDIEAGGCIHEQIVSVFPELEPYIKWHLVSSDAPLHYVANTVYLAGDKNCYGLDKGKDRELDAARRWAVWLDATDEELTAPGLEQRLQARLPKLMKDFQAAVESLGLVW